MPWRRPEERLAELLAAGNQIRGLSLEGRRLKGLLVAAREIEAEDLPVRKPLAPYLVVDLPSTRRLGIRSLKTLEVLGFGFDPRFPLELTLDGVRLDVQPVFDDKGVFRVRVAPALGLGVHTFRVEQTTDRGTFRDAYTFNVVVEDGPESPGPDPGSDRDPAVERIDFDLLRRVDRFNAVVRITGVVKNIGGLPYESRPGQQSISLYENRRLVRTLEFQNLAPGEEILIRYERDWNTSSSAEGEFPPVYEVLISYDPDIVLDGNPGNDDGNMSNNRRTRDGAEINRLVTPP